MISTTLSCNINGCAGKLLCCAVLKILMYYEYIGFGRCA